MIIFLNVRSAALQVWNSGLSQNIGGRIKGSCLTRYVTQKT